MTEPIYEPDDEQEYDWLSFERNKCLWFILLVSLLLVVGASGEWYLRSLYPAAPEPPGLPAILLASDPDEKPKIVIDQICVYGPNFMKCRPVPPIKLFKGATAHIRYDISAN
jgi:hypothetical protein